MFFKSKNVKSAIKLGTIIFIAWIVSRIINRRINTDVGLTTIQLITKYDYPAEVHSNLTTPDGYMLDIHRIPHGKGLSRTPNKKVVLLMPAFLCSSADWVNAGPERGLGYILADNGYDVWMGNPRGTTSSRKHVRFNPDEDKEYWDYSWHEIGTYDLPTIIDYVLKVTESKDLYYIGHSQGTTALFVMMSEHPEYNEKIRLMVAFGPAAFMLHTYNPIFRLFVNSFENSAVRKFTDYIGYYEMMSHSYSRALVGDWFCHDTSPFQEVCALFFSLSSGFSNQLNKTLIPVIATNTPAGGSIKQFLHFMQLMRNGNFNQYDYGKIQNSLVYGQEYPPSYDLSKVTVPVAIFYGKGDWIIDTQDVGLVSMALPQVVHKQLVDEERFNHFNFLWAFDICSLLYDYVIDTMNTFSNYDYGPQQNLEKYGEEYPPQYSLNSVKVPIAIFYSKGDWLIDEQDAELVCQQLPNVVHKHLLDVHFKHLDFLWSVHVVPALYEDVLDIMGQF